MLYTSTDLEESREADNSLGTGTPQLSAQIQGKAYNECYFLALGAQHGKDAASWVPAPASIAAISILSST